MKKRMKFRKFITIQQKQKTKRVGGELALPPVARTDKKALSKHQQKAISTTSVDKTTHLPRKKGSKTPHYIIQPLKKIKNLDQNRKTRIAKKFKNR